MCDRSSSLVGMTVTRLLDAGEVTSIQATL